MKDTLPIELVEAFLLASDVVSILRCRQVSRFLKGIVDSSLHLQYTVELFCSNQIDVPACKKPVAERFAMLTDYQVAWRHLARPTISYLKLSGNTWELVEGVMGMSLGVGVLEFSRPASIVRGIEGKQWTVDLGVGIRDFTMSLSLDLIVAISFSDVNQEADSIRLCKLSDGKPHLDNNLIPLVDARHKSATSFSLQIYNSLLGILFAGDDYTELVIWDWRTGVLKRSWSNLDRSSFAFLTSDLVLVGLLEFQYVGPRFPGLVLHVVSIEGTSSERDLKKKDIVISLAYPKLALHTHSAELHIQASDPPAENVSSASPFTTSNKTDRLFVIKYTAHGSGPIVSFLPFSEIMRKVDTVSSGQNQRGRVFKWSEWGVDGTRTIRLNPTDVWVCYAHGMRFTIQKTLDSSPATARSVAFKVYDFYLPSVRRHLTSGHDKNQPAVTYILKPSTLDKDRKMFEHPLTTTLPCRVTTLTSDEAAFANKKLTGVMLAEDFIVGVHDDDLFSVHSF